MKFRRNPDEDLRKLERIWKTDPSIESLRDYTIGLARSGASLEALDYLFGLETEPFIAGAKHDSELLQSIIDLGLVIAKFAMAFDALLTFDLLFRRETMSHPSQQLLADLLILRLARLGAHEIPLLPANWRVRRGFSQDDSRFEIERNDDGWQLNDYAYATYLSADNKREALRFKEFAEKYVIKHGDIDLGSFPYSLEDPLHYDDLEYIVSFWIRAYP